MAHCAQLPPVEPPQLERYRPEPQELHAVHADCPRLVWNLPAAQAVHEILPAVDDLPLAHWVHVAVHDAPVLVLKVPALQGVHLPKELAPHSVRYEPPAQVLQSVHFAWPVVS